MVTPPASAPLIMEPIQRGLRRSQNPGRRFDACAFVWMAISEDRDEARNMLADVVAYFGTYLDPRALGVLGLTVDDLRPAYNRIMARDRAGARAALTPQMLRLGIYGTPDECAAELKRRAKAVILEDWGDEIEELSPLEVTLKLDGQEGTVLPVRLESLVTEVGTLEVWCVSRDGSQRWKLELNIREKET
jgi:hypothetical protein